MFYVPYFYPYPFYFQLPIYDWSRTIYQNAPIEIVNDQRSNDSHHSNSERIKLQDYGKHPFVVNIEEASKQNSTFRTALWTGSHLQLALMSLNVGEDIGLEIHPTVDQFLRVEDGQGLVQMGQTKDNLSFRARVSDDDAIFVPAGYWHNLTNTGRKPLKLYTIYAPPEHPHGTIHKTKADAIAAEESH